MYIYKKIIYKIANILFLLILFIYYKFWYFFFFYFIKLFYKTIELELNYLLFF